jgi:UDP-glucose 4-epimerase
MILVTGGAGFIGSNLVDCLLSDGHSVRVLDNLSTGSLRNLLNAQSFADRFDFYHADIESFDDVVKASIGVSCIVHLAAQVSVQYSLRHPVESASSNVIGFLNMLEAARINKVSRFIYASSAAVYGHPAELPLSETSTLAPISPYGLEKQINEQYAKLYSEIHGLSCLGFRFFNVYGPRQDPKSPYAGVISKFFERVANDQAITIFGDGRQTRDFVYVADVVNACAKAINSNATGVLCVGTGCSVNLLQLVDGIEMAICKRAQVFYAEAVDGDIVESAMVPINLKNHLNVSADTALHEGLTLLWQSLQHGVVACNTR